MVGAGFAGSFHAGLVFVVPRKEAEIPPVALSI